MHEDCDQLRIANGMNHCCVHHIGHSNNEDSCSKSITSSQMLWMYKGKGVCMHVESTSASISEGSQSVHIKTSETETLDNRLEWMSPDKEEFQNSKEVQKI